MQRLCAERRMTLPPEKIGDKGQRYEVRYFDGADRTLKTFGWAKTLASAERLCDAIRIHPVWNTPTIFDRATDQTEAHRIATGRGT